MRSLTKFHAGREDAERIAAEAWPPSTAAQPAEATTVPLPLAMQGPAAEARQLLLDANCTEEQLDAVALLAFSLQRRFDARPDKARIACQ